MKGAAKPVLAKRPAAPHTQDDPSAVAALTSALVDANDQLVALYSLTSLAARPLDERTAVDLILARGCEVLSSDLTLWTADRADGFEAEPDAEARGAAVWTREGRPGRNPAFSVTIEGEGASQRLWWRLTARRWDTSFGTAERKLMTAISDVLIGAIEAARHHRMEVKRAIKERDYDTASELASLALPRWRPEVDGVQVYARSDSAQASGGDLYCFAAPNGILHFAVGDVSGKGLPAAMIMTNVISAATASFHTGQAEPGVTDTAAVNLASIDSWVYPYLQDVVRFVTLVVGRYDPATRELEVANAGHSPVLYVSDGEIFEVPASVPPIGVLPLDTILDDADPDSTFRCTVSDGDRLVVASDGFTEQPEPGGEMFGLEPVSRMILSTALSASEVGDRLFDLVEAFAQSEPQMDDRTLVIVDFGPRTVEPLMLEPEFGALSAIAPWLADVVAAADGAIPDDIIGGIELSIHEMAANSIEHATSTGDWICIEAELFDDRLVTTLTDSGSVGFDRSAVDTPDPAVPQEGGYGIMIVEQLASQVDYQRINDTNRWDLTFRFGTDPISEN